MTKYQLCLWSCSDQKPAVFFVISIFFSATLARARTPNVYQRDTLLAKNGVTFYVSAIVGAEQRFRPQQHISGNNVAGVTLGSVTSYVGTIVGAEQRFRPQQRVSGNNVAGVTLGSVTSYITHRWQAL